MASAGAGSERADGSTTNATPSSLPGARSSVAIKRVSTQRSSNLFTSPAACLPSPITYVSGFVMSNPMLRKVRHTAFVVARYPAMRTASTFRHPFGFPSVSVSLGVTVIGYQPPGTAFSGSSSEALYQPPPLLK